MYFFMLQTMLSPAAARRWLEAHNDAVVAVVLVALGVMLVLKGAQGL